MEKIVMVKEWLNQIKLSDEERDLIVRKAPTPDNTVDNNLASEYFSRLPYSGLKTDDYCIDFSSECRYFINMLFDKYVDDDTTVITTDCEHPSVSDNFSKCKNIIYFDDIDKTKLNIHKLDNIKTSKAFVYIIGTHVKNGLYTPQDFFIKIKNSLKLKNIKTIMVIDAVQELFLRPRDYTIFDYILGTAHALVLPFDMGIMIHKKNDNVILHNNEYNNCGREYLKVLDIVISKKDKLNDFNHIMSDYFYDKVMKCCRYYTFRDSSNSSGNLFHIYSANESIITEKMHDKWFKNFYVEVDGMYIIRFRAQNYLYKPELLLPGIKEIEDYLEMVNNE